MVEGLSFRGPELAVQASGSSRWGRWAPLPPLDPVVQNLAGYPKLASAQGRTPSPPLNTLDRLQFASRGNWQFLSSCCYRSSSKCLSPRVIVSHLRGAVQYLSP